jgi:hypothetical protein
MTKKLLITPENPNGIVVDYSAEEETQLQTDISASANEQSMVDKIEAKQTDQASGNQKLLDLGLTQAEATALTGYTPPSEE